MSMGEAMRAEGYSKTYAKSPDKLRKTDSWQALMEKYLPEKELARHHKELLNANEIGKFDFSMHVSDEEIKEVVEEEYGFRIVKIVEVYTDDKKFRRKTAYYLVPNTKAKKDALDMAYKLNKKYGDTTIIHKFGGLSDAELEEELSGELSKGFGDSERAEEKTGKQ